MSKKIMLIDDAMSIRQSVGFCLRESGYEVIEAQNGIEALKKLGVLPMDLIICDVNMPNMDGLSLLKKIKSDPSYMLNRYAPFIMLTTESGEDRREEGKLLGARVWMLKPFKLEKLLDAVKKLIS